MTIKQIDNLIVKFNDKLVGTLTALKDGSISFEYDDNWLSNGFSISPISLPLEKRVFICEKTCFDGLYGVFWDSLPDGWGERFNYLMLSKTNIKYDDLSPLQKLALVKDNGLGGLTYEPSLNDFSKSSVYDLDTLASYFKDILNEEYDIDKLDNIYDICGCCGGARPKAHLTFNNEEWIVKFPCLNDSSNNGYEEYLANKLAKSCNINVNEYKLFPSNMCKGYFGAKRFDRDKNKKVHMISLCAILETTHRIPNLDYGHLFAVINKICNDKENMYEAFRRMCFNVYYQNKDDHGKNFAFLYDEKLKSYKLSPAYDITKTSNKLEHEMSINDSGNPTDSDILNLAKDFDLNINKCKEILFNIKSMINNN